MKSLLRERRCLALALRCLLLAGREYWVGKIEKSVMLCLTLSLNRLNPCSTCGTLVAVGDAVIGVSAQSRSPRLQRSAFSDRGHISIPLCAVQAGSVQVCGAHQRGVVRGNDSVGWALW